MATFYEEMKEVATELLSEFRQAVSYRTYSQTAPSNPWDKPTIGTATNYNLIDAVVEGFAPQRVDGTLIQANDLNVTASASSFEAYGLAPSLTGFFVISGREHRVLSIKPLPADGENTLAYECHVRAV